MLGQGWTGNVQMQELKGRNPLTQDLVPSSKYFCPEHNSENVQDATASEKGSSSPGEIY